LHSILREKKLATQGSHENTKEKEKKNGSWWWWQPPRDLHEWEVMS